jgi:hypothetical protein
MAKNMAKGNINVENIKWLLTKDCLLNMDFLLTINHFQPKNLIIEILIPKVIEN